MQHMPAAWLLIRQTHMSLGRIAAEDIGMEYMTSIAVLSYEFVHRLKTWSLCFLTFLSAKLQDLQRLLSRW